MSQNCLVWGNKHTFGDQKCLKRGVLGDNTGDTQEGRLGLGVLFLIQFVGHLCVCFGEMCFAHVSIGLFVFVVEL